MSTDDVRAAECQNNSSNTHASSLNCDLSQEEVKDDSVHKVCDPTANISTSWTGSSDGASALNTTEHLDVSTKMPAKPVPRAKHLLKKQNMIGERIRHHNTAAITEHKQPDIRGRKKVNDALKSGEPSDPVIEQWYADPYNRYDPEGPADYQLRKQTLTNALRNRGFRGPRIVNVVNWLIRCKGQHKDYNDLVGVHCRKRRGRSRFQGQSGTIKRKLGTPKFATQKNQARNVLVTPTKTLVDEDNDTSVLDHTTTFDSPTSPIHKSPYPSPTSNAWAPCDSDHEAMYMELDHSNSNRVSSIDFDAESDTDADADVDADAKTFSSKLDFESDMADDDDLTSVFSMSMTESEVAALHQLQSSLQPTRPVFHSIHGPDTQGYRDDYDDWYLEALKRTQEFWSIIYGDDLDGGCNSSSSKAKAKRIRIKNEGSDDVEDVDSKVDENEMDVKITWFRDPGGLPTVDVRYHSQGLKSVKKVMYQGKEVRTEDETFGLYFPPKSQKIRNDI